MQGSRRLLLPLALILGAAACGADAPPELRVAPVLLGTVELREITERIEAPGELLAKSRAAIAAEVSGQVTEIRVDEGEALEAGAVAIEIDPERHELNLADVRARVAESRASLAEQRSDTERVRKLHRRDVASQAQLQTAETELATARSRLEASQAALGVAERALRDSSVTAPFAGLIAERFVHVGEFVQPGQKLFELVSLDPIEVEFHLAEVDSSRARLGQSVEVVVSPYPDEHFLAEVSFVSPTIDSRTRTLRIKARLPNPEGRLRPGLFARVELGVAHRSDVAMIPEESVLQRADGAVVFRVGAESRVERRVVETGLYRDGWVEVVAGLSDDDTVVRRGHANLIDGAIISARNPDGSPAVGAPAANGAEAAVH